MADILDKVQLDMLSLDLKKEELVEFLLRDITGRFHR